jgi:hypothetical protein
MVYEVYCGPMYVPARPAVVCTRLPSNLRLTAQRFAFSWLPPHAIVRAWWRDASAADVPRQQQMDCTRLSRHHYEAVQDRRLLRTRERGRH